MMALESSSQSRGITMKTKNKTLLALVAALGLLSAWRSNAQPIYSVQSLENRAVAASPRAKELFPWLIRSGTKHVTTGKTSDTRVFATSPRMLEQFPELARPAQPWKSMEGSIGSTVIKNRGFASTPRAREEFPWLARGSYTVNETPFEIAPLK